MNFGSGGQISPNPSLSRGEQDTSLIKEGDHEVVEDLSNTSQKDRSNMQMPSDFPGGEMPNFA
jgi:hypothetical protein